jgi:hypothetical protein
MKKTLQKTYFILKSNQPALCGCRSSKVEAQTVVKPDRSMFRSGTFPDTKAKTTLILQFNSSLKDHQLSQSRT